jgi:hypothetical protein
LLSLVSNAWENSRKSILVTFTIVFTASKNGKIVAAAAFVGELSPPLVGGLLLRFKILVALAVVLGSLSGFRLVASAGTPATIITWTGTPQSTAANTNFQVALVAVVRDANGNGVQGASVVFSAPGGSTAGATFGGSSTASVTSDANGAAVAPTLMANGVGGSYNVIATVAGVAGSAVFSMTNTGGTTTGTGTPEAPVGLRFFSVNGPPAGGGETVVWTNVTPVGITLDPNGTAAGPTNNYGVQGVFADPAHPGTLYAPVTYQGLWKSTDYGLTWAKVAVTSGPAPMDNSRGNLQIAPDGSYMVAAALYPINGIQNGSWKSLNGGLTWSHYNTGATGEDVEGFSIDPNDKTRVLASPHTAPYNIFESRDSGQTFVNLGPTGVSFPHFFWLDENTVLAIGDGDNGTNGNGTWRGVRSRSTWPWTWSWTKVSTQQHWHGSSQVYIDPSTGAIFTGGGFGIQKSVDNGASWTTVTSTYSAGIVGTATTLYSTANYANNGGGFGPFLMHASRAAGGVAWAADTGPAAMNNGWIHAAVVFDGAHYVIVAGSWNAGIWRYVEP